MRNAISNQNISNAIASDNQVVVFDGLKISDLYIYIYIYIYILKHYSYTIANAEILLVMLSGE